MNGHHTPPRIFPAGAPNAPLTRRLRLRKWWGAASGNMRGSVLIGGAILIFGVMIACIKEIGSSLPLPQIIVIRQVIITLLLLPLFLPDLRSTLQTKHLGLQITRGFAKREAVDILDGARIKREPGKFLCCNCF